LLGNLVHFRQEALGLASVGVANDDVGNFVVDAAGEQTERNVNDGVASGLKSVEKSPSFRTRIADEDLSAPTAAWCRLTP
jgi:hypothetical protein